MVQYSIDPVALAQADDILDYIYEHSGIDKSRVFFTLLNSLVKNIREFPQHGRLAHKDTKTEIRCTSLPTPFRNYFVYWRATDDEIVIERIVHSSRQDRTSHAHI